MVSPSGEWVCVCAELWDLWEPPWYCIYLKRWWREGGCGSGSGWDESPAFLIGLFAGGGRVYALAIH